MTRAKVDKFFGFINGQEVLYYDNEKNLGREIFQQMKEMGYFPGDINDYAVSRA